MARSLISSLYRCSGMRPINKAAAKVVSHASRDVKCDKRIISRLRKDAYLRQGKTVKAVARNDNASRTVIETTGPKLAVKYFRVFEFVSSSGKIAYILFVDVNDGRGVQPLSAVLHKHGRPRQCDVFPTRDDAYSFGMKIKKNGL